MLSDKFAVFCEDFSRGDLLNRPQMSRIGGEAEGGMSKESEVRRQTDGHGNFGNVENEMFVFAPKAEYSPWYGRVANPRRNQIIAGGTALGSSRTHAGVAGAGGSRELSAGDAGNRTGK